MYIILLRMNSIDLLESKNDINSKVLDENIILTILDCFNQSNIKPIKIIKKQINILKNNKMQTKKNLNANKIIMIMNKLSCDNINSLIIEYLSTITLESSECYNMIQYEIFSKLFKDITLINNYIPFIIKLFSIEKHKLNLDPIHFIDILNSVIQSHYISFTNTSITDHANENDRITCLKIIKQLIIENFFTNDMYNYISKLLLSQKTYIIDVYYWFVDSPHLKNQYTENIHEYIRYCKLNNLVREELMLETMMSEIQSTIIKPITITPIITDQSSDVFIVSIQNIIDEYLYLEFKEEVVKFINSDCRDLNEKNIFCKELLIYYFTQKNKSLLILKLFEYLIKNKHLYKSNLSKGLILYLDKNNKDDNIQIFLRFLKNNNITKNIEHLFKKYRIKL